MKQSKRNFTTKSLVSCALLAALSIVLARVLSFATPDGVRWSLDKFPLFLAGLLFGPLFGSLTGFTADFLGSLMQFGFNPLLMPPAVLYGLFGGLFRYFIAKRCNVWRTAVGYFFPIFFGSILYQSCMLAYLYFDGAWFDGLLYYLGTRSVQFSIMLVVEVSIIFSLIKARVFDRLGVWPPRKRKERKEQ